MMGKFVLLALLGLGVERGYSQATAWAQCGGSGWTGATTCVSGYVCTFSNTWYSQCLPGTATSSTSSTAVSSTTSKTSTSVTTLTTVTTTSSKSTTTSSATSVTTTASACTASFTALTAANAFAGLDPGWNLGNTLDATPDEGSWNNPPVTAAVLSNVVAAGFKSIRIPVTWSYHFVDSSPTWTVNTTWMDRVETVVDEALATGAYVILNVHHDSWIWMDVTASGANYTMIEEKFARLWSQIGTRFACKSSKLLFEAVNEPTGSTSAHADELNKLSGIFLTAINNAGGYNPQRVVALSGLGMDSVKTSEWFSRGTLYPNQPWGLEFHYYSPYDFIFSAWGKTIWGSAADKAAIDTDLSLFHGNFSTIPTFIGEWDASTANTETAARWKYFDYFIRAAKSYNYSTVLWDNGNDHLNRTTNVWRDPTILPIWSNALKGVSNTLADSTTDASATSQNSSAYMFHKVGDAVVDQTVPYLLNGNTLVSVTSSSGTKLATTAYSMSSTGTFTLTAAYLSTLFTSTAIPGLKGTITLTFSAGAALPLQIWQYSAPTIATTTYSLSSISSSSDFYIPVTYNGLPIVAAVKAMNADGTYMVSGDDWTVYLGPLQQARWTYSSWNWDANNFIIAASGITTMKTIGQTITLTVEFFPRVLGSNSVNLTFTQ